MRRVVRARHLQEEHLDRREAHRLRRGAADQLGRPARLHALREGPPDRVVQVGPVRGTENATGSPLPGSPFCFDPMAGQRWMACPIAASAASITPSCMVGWAWMVRAMRWAVAPSARASVGSASISVTWAPTRCAPSRRPSSSAKSSLTKPSRSPAAVALPEAVKGKRPAL